MKARRWIRSIVATCLSISGAARAAPDLPPAYQPQVQQVTGNISIWGHGALGGRFDFIEAVVKKWEQGFHAHQPRVTFENRLHGTASAMGALYTGTGDMALMGREVWPFEIAAFKEVRGYAPTGIDVVTGSYKTRNRGYAVIVFVHKDNPIQGLTLRQLDGIYSLDRKRGGPAVHTWGDLGVAGDWADKPVSPYSFSLARGFTDFLEDAVLAGGRRWRPDVKEFADLPGSLGGATDGASLMLEALAKDRYGVAFSGAQYANADVKPIAVALDDGSPFVMPSEATVMDHSYPLTRIITLFIDRKPGQPVAPHIREFVRYMLSREGQEAVLQEGGGYLPVLAPQAAIELDKLD